MTRKIAIHSTHPQLRLLRQVAGVVARGGLIVYPTDSCYALGCGLGQKNAVARLRKIRQLETKHLLTLVCRDLSEISKYARVSNPNYRLLRMHTPGPYTFLLPASHDVPRKLLAPKRRTLGLRVPDHAIAQALLETLDAPLISATLTLPGMDAPLIEPDAIAELLGGQVDMIIDGGFCGLEPTSVIDLTGEDPKVIREGKGAITAFL